jgi:two-component sensor histidine kinase
VYIVRCEVNGQTIAVQLSDQGTFSHNDNNWTIEFGGVNLRGDEPLRYRYRLLPVDQEWHSPQVNRVVAFPALEPGSYTFEVVSLNAEGIESLHPASLSFTIASPFWRTWWFLTLSVGVFLALVGFGFRYHVNRLVAIERLRLRISSDLHDELASNLSSIALFGSIVQEGTTPHDTQRLIERMTALAHDSLASLRHIIWAIEPKAETLEAFLTRLAETLSPACRAQQITLAIETLSEHVRHVQLKPDQRQHLWLLLKEAVTNAVKHSRASNVSLHASTSGNMLRIVITDDGVGFDGAATSQGKGLGTMRMRARLLRGSLQVTSVHGKGTQLILQIRR